MKKTDYRVERDSIGVKAVSYTHLTKDIDRAQVAGIGFGGQMHGLVTLDKDDNVIRPAILWNRCV